MAVLTNCSCVLKVKDQSGNAYGSTTGTTLNNAELLFYTRKSQVNASDALYISRQMRSQSQPGKVIQDLIYIAKTTPTTVPTVAYTGGGTAGSEVVTVTGTAISVQIQTAVSTAIQVQTAINNSVAAAALVYCVISGTSSTAQVIVGATSLSDEYCYLILAETTTNNQQGIFKLSYTDGSYYDEIIFDPFKIPAQSYLDLSTVLTVSRG